MKETDIYTRDCRNCAKESTETVNNQRFIEKLDNYFSVSDIDGALGHI